MLLSLVISITVSHYLLDCHRIQSNICLQLVQNTRVPTKTGIFEHISPILASLNWLPVVFRIDFKILLFVFKSLNGLGPSYISNLLSLCTPPRTLRSADQLLLSDPRVRLETEGSRAFAARALQLWNALPLEIRKATSVFSFTSLLKTHLYMLAFN